MRERCRVVHVTGCLNLGGQEKLLIEFARHADRDRFDLRFVSLESRGVLADELEALGWQVASLDLGPGLHVGLPWRLAKLFRSWRTDVVHTHNDRPLLYAAIAAQVAGARLIHTKHGRSTGNTSRQTLLTAWSARLARHFVCVSDDSARLAMEQGVPANRIVTVHNGIDTRRFDFRGPCLSGPAVVVARLCADKDLGTLLRAVALLKKECPEFKLAIAGDGPCKSELQQLVADAGLHANVTFLGAINDVPSLLATARMSVLSSVSEGVPLTLLEAMARGLPVVATRVGGIPEVVTDGDNGFLVPPRDPAALAHAILRVQTDDELARKFGRAGRRCVEERFDVRRMVARYEALYGVEQSSPRRVAACASHI
jgi:glycosyltransferase involved in cell wall biosynthesis